MRRLKPEECHIYLDGQQYFIGVVLNISREATSVRGSINSYNSINSINSINSTQLVSY